MEEIKRQFNKEEYLEFIEQWKLDNKELIDSGKCRKIFLENLPRWNNGKNKGCIDWSNCVNMMEKKKKLFHIEN